MVVEKARAEVRGDVDWKEEAEELACWRWWANLEEQSGALGLALATRLRVDARAKVREAMKLMSGESDGGERGDYSK